MNFGSASSPLLYRDLVIVNADVECAAIIAFRKRDGKEVWRFAPGHYKDGLYFAKEESVRLYCVEAATGKLNFEERLLPSVRRMYASPVLISGKLYCVTQTEGTFVVAASPEFELVAHNVIKSKDSDFSGSPAVSGDRLLLRSNGDYTFLTGTEGWTSTGIKSGISADQVVANAVGQATRFPSLQLSIHRGTNYGQQGLATLSWNRNGIPLAAENDPHSVFQRLFGVDDERDAVRRHAGFRRRGSILDYVNDQAKHLEHRVGRADREKLDEYFTSVREIENQLQRDIDWSKKPKARPELDGLGDYSRSLTPESQGFDYTTYQKLMFDLIALAFQTDSTRVITYNIRRELSGGTFPVHKVSKNFHALTHHNNDPKNLSELAQVDEINMGFWSTFLARMDQIPQTDGRSLLEHTTIAYSSSAGMDHSRDRLPTAIFGGEALGLAHQTHLKLAEGTPLSRVWHTLADRMGVHTETLQDSHGPITELLRG